jgi:hypothetical protein
MERNLAVLKTEDPAGRIAGLCFEMMKTKGRPARTGKGR